MAANDGAPLIRNIRCVECNGVLHGDWTEVACDRCGATYAPIPLGRLVLRQDEVVRFTTTNALVAMTTATH